MIKTGDMKATRKNEKIHKQSQSNRNTNHNTLKHKKAELSNRAPQSTTVTFWSFLHNESVTGPRDIVRHYLRTTNLTACRTCLGVLSNSNSDYYETISAEQQDASFVGTRSGNSGLISPRSQYVVISPLPYNNKAESRKIVDLHSQALASPALSYEALGHVPTSTIFIILCKTINISVYHNKILLTPFPFPKFSFLLTPENNGQLKLHRNHVHIICFVR